jgi:hypothetical protein
MILMIITLVATIIGVWILCKADFSDAIMEIGALFAVCGGILAFIMAIIIITEHVSVDARIEENRIEYESLCERNEIVASEYEDVSKSDVIKDIAEWNKNVYSYKHWAYNPWTNWFYSKRVADQMEMIER